MANWLLPEGLSGKFELLVRSLTNAPGTFNQYSRSSVPARVPLTDITANAAIQLSRNRMLRRSETEFLLMVNTIKF